MKYKRLITLVLIFTIMLNFAFVPRSEASVIALEGGKALLLLLLGALGITVATQTELEGLYGALDWDSMIVANHINIGDYSKPPGEPPDYDKLKKAILVGGTAVAVGFSGLLDDLKEWFQSLGSKEGNNLKNVGADIIVNDTKVFIKATEGDNTIYTFDGYSINVNIYKTQLEDGSFRIYANWYKPDGTLGYGPQYIGFISSNDSFDDLGIYLGSQQLSTKKYIFGEANLNLDMVTNTIGFYESDFTNVPTTLPTSKNIYYNVSPNSSIITDTLPTYIPQPDIGTLPNIQEIITPEGEKKLIYPGTMDDLVTDLNNNITFEDLISSINGQTNSYTLTETQQGIEIDYGIITETPYPDIDIEPIEDTSQFQGENIGLLKSIVNWLSNILESIYNIPNNLIDTITGLFVPEENYIGGKMENINSIINSKLGQTDGTPLLGAFSLFDCEYIENQKGSVSLPGGISQEVDFVNTEWVNSMAQTIREWQRFLWWVTIVLISMNNIYKLVRGTDLITIKGPEGTGWGSAGRKARGGG